MSQKSNLIRLPVLDPADGLPHDAVGNDRHPGLIPLARYPKEINCFFCGHPVAAPQNADRLIDHRLVGQRRLKLRG